MSDGVRISELAAATPPYAGASLFEVSVPAGGSAYNTRRITLTDVTNSVLAIGALAKAGDTMTGPLVLNANPTLALGAATKQYVDAAAENPFSLIVTDFGAIGDGVTDSTQAFRDCIAAAIAAKKSVYVPAGTYKLTDMITLGVGQRMFGADRSTSNIRIYNDFNMAALGVVKLSGGSAGSIIYDIGFIFTQPATPTRATMIQYPPAINMVNVNRVIIDNVRISGAWDGIDARANCGGSYLGFLEIGAINCGIYFGADEVDPIGSPGSLDFVHGGHWHFWPFGFSDATRLPIWEDGQTTAMQCGRVDGFEVSSITTFYANLHFLPEVRSAPYQFGRIMMDGTRTQLTISGSTEPGRNGKLFIDNFHVKCLSTINAVIVGDSGLLHINHLDFYGGSASAAGNDSFVVDGDEARLLIGNGFVFQHPNAKSPNNSMFLLKKGLMMLSNIQFQESPGVLRAVPQVKVEGANSIIRMTGCTFNPREADTGSVMATGFALTIASDHPRNLIANNDFADWGVVFPTVIAAGEYGPNGFPASLQAIPEVSFSTNGNFVPTYTTQLTTYVYTGGSQVSYTTLITFNANMFTTASGVLRIDPGLRPKPATTAVASIGQLARIGFPADSPLAAEMGTDGIISIRVFTSGGAVDNLKATNFTPGMTAITIRVGGTFRYK